MTATLIDTNIFLDLITDDPLWLDWSVSQLAAAAMVGRLVIVDVVYAELAARFSSREMLDEFLGDFHVVIEPTHRDALFEAGKAYARYRKAGGERTGVLPDLFIGAHASAVGMPLLTRDPRRYRTYFPDVMLIEP